MVVSWFVNKLSADIHCLFSVRLSGSLILRWGGRGA